MSPPPPPDLSVEARILSATADNASDVIAVAEERVGRVESGSEALAETIRETRRMVSDASSALDDAESRCESRGCSGMCGSMAVCVPGFSSLV